MHKTGGIQQNINLANTFRRFVDGVSIEHIELERLSNTSFLEIGKCGFVDVARIYMRAFTRKQNRARTSYAC